MGVCCGWQMSTRCFERQSPSSPFFQGMRHSCPMSLRSCYCHWLCLGHLIKNLLIGERCRSSLFYDKLNDQDQWQIATTSTVKCVPSLVIAPGRTVRILGRLSKSEDPPVAKLEIVMGVPEEFLLSELWYCRTIKEILGLRTWWRIH